MVWAGEAFSQLIPFTTGTPTGDVAYTLTDQAGTVLVTDDISPSVGAASVVITIMGDDNDCALPLFEMRTLAWSYPTASGTVSGRMTYRVNRPVPFAVSSAGVRAKLGIEAHELPDDDVDLARAYGALLLLLPDADLDALSLVGDYAALLCLDAIEALAALDALPRLQLKLAQRETSGTNEYQRFGTIDWEALRASLLGYVDALRAAIDPDFDGDAVDFTLFSLASRAGDPFTGS